MTHPVPDPKAASNVTMDDLAESLHVGPDINDADPVDEDMHPLCVRLEHYLEREGDERFHIR